MEPRVREGELGASNATKTTITLEDGLNLARLPRLRGGAARGAESTAPQVSLTNGQQGGELCAVCQHEQTGLKKKATAWRDAAAAHSALLGRNKGLFMAPRG